MGGLSMEGIKATDIKDFQSEVFCITGSIPHWSRGDLFTQIEVRDGEYVDRMTKSVTVLVYGYRTGSKIDKAIQYGTKLMEWSEFLTLLAMTPVVDTEKAKHIQSIYDGTPRKYLGGAHVVQPMDKKTHPLDPSPAREGSMHQEDVSKVQEVQEVCKVSHETISTVTTPLTHREGLGVGLFLTHSEGKWGWVSGIAAVFIILMKGVSVICGLAICVCLWLIGIPARP